MNSKIISFITCVNNEEYYNESLKHIDKLNIPEGYSIEKIAITNAKSMCSGYNEGMKQAKGLYKVYLHQDVGILNKDFIYDIINIFQDKTIGLMGVVGTAFLDRSVIWWSRKEYLYGMVRHFSPPSPIFKNLFQGVKDVVALDGLLLATQYDIPWREDLLTSWHCYDISQCLEFQKAGKRVVLPRQTEIWCCHGFDGRTADLNNFDESRAVLLNYYSEMIPRIV